MRGRIGRYRIMKELTACQDCKHLRREREEISGLMINTRKCLKSPVGRFDPFSGIFIFDSGEDYYYIADVNIDGHCPKFEEGKEE